MLRDSESRWGSLSQFFHWSVAALIFALIALGWLVRLTPLSPGQITLFYWHKSLGMLALALVLVRLGWRAGNRPPPLPGGLPRWEAPLARTTHVALYLLILLMPVSGWLVNSASGIPFKIFWVLPLPAIAPVSAGLEHAFELLHLASFSALALLLVGHIGAALRHHFLLHNDVFLRMLPRGRRRTR
ncbi:MAG TPA: cytochrome b/b6 domain-containing protein [Gammaproteobacteria bacterium]|nr:cytochrome b/b6 domain-containing protein [Gammaproteobacteria bacterium]